MSASTTTQPFTTTRILKPIINNTVDLYENRNDSFIEISKDNNKRDISEKKFSQKRKVLYS